ncbi:ImmA/IrrE family metallo-endopeptidase [Microbacterium fluvii]|uniref:ImmA/IrrE family metallo-endopeptidase n=1 Tax=Microbacterium fluvii TaxID=415215 RepID=A0ABW2HFL8_9MICO|nr:ImmA/IrrE family metallo-endopeptidase [Microbacterium fluvii]MCU4673738.1 ImmA/IrrE family metallo-endopeptidase [Microbacterium fluvii]
MAEVSVVGKSAYACAHDVIREHLLDSEGMLNIPVDPFGLASKLGIEVSFGQLSEGTAGLIVREAEADATRVLLNRSDAANRQKFTLAHELGHYFRHQSDGDHVFGYVDERADLASRGTNEEEIWSNKFAAELLMPGFAVRQLYSEGWDLRRLAREFAVSEAAMGYRLQNLGLA